MGEIMTYIAPLWATDGHMLAVACGVQADYMSPVRPAGLVRCAQTGCLHPAGMCTKQVFKKDLEFGGK
jgi:hypothetical protein